MLPLFIAALANVTSLGVIVPLLPFQAEGVGASPAEIAWLFAVYSLTQFLTSPPANPKSSKTVATRASALRSFSADSRSSAG